MGHMAAINQRNQQIAQAKEQASAIRAQTAALEAANRNEADRTKIEQQRASHNQDSEQAASVEEFVTELTANQSAIQAFLISLMPGDPGTDDVLQQTNLTLWRKRSAYRSGSNFRAWAFECAKWSMRAYLKEKRRKSWLIVDDELTRAVTERMIDRPPSAPSDARSALAICLGRLRQHDRDLLLSYYEDGKSLAQCAAHSGRTAGALKVTLFRLRTALRRCITDRLAIGDARH
jgi:RNA polymerase sigma-70 factor (ECF subfamily)